MMAADRGVPHVDRLAPAQPELGREKQADLPEGMRNPSSSGQNVFGDFDR
jgi:hypothetical protein